ncbi:hypothetical protein [Longimycelium tulufanense]|uniref:hypothetical protein n=1 Tax=Longimycelium tulufanense TaxID=907463 RepID=UPI00166E1E63|nr:hypothetical protein [Longimycelium tulufanense]
MNRRQLRRSCSSLVEKLALPVPAEPEQLMDRLCELMGERLGLPVHRRLVGFPPGTVSGLWVATDAAHYILCEQDTSPWHQLVIFCHEFGHIAVKHDTAPLPDSALPTLPFASLDSHTVERIIARRTYCSSPEEKHAEIFGSLLLARVSRWLPQQTWVVPENARDIVQRLETTFEAQAERRRRG